MQASPTAHTADERTTLDGIAPRAWVAGMVIGVVGLAVSLVLGLMRDDRLQYFLHSYLLNYCYFLSISLGALFFVALQHATRAGWSVTVRRLAEVLAGNTGCLAILFLPILVQPLLGEANLFRWADAGSVAGDELLQHKAPYLNPTFFAIRCVLYFAVWGLLARFFLLRSVEQDHSGDAALTVRMERLGPVALLLFACTVTFASFDWLMSLEPSWFSTIFGVYYFSGAVVGFLATIILLAALLQAAGRLNRSITIEHYHDLGKLLFAFVVFWGYIAFSQYMLIWYANIPEETTWYLVRQSGSWKWVSLLLLFGHLLIPFFGLLSRGVKRRKILLGFWAAWLLVAHWIDIYWLVMPSLEPGGAPLGPIDACCLLGIGGIYLAGLARTVGNRSLVPLADPRLEESLAFENN
jgi:hypothetical protein